MIDHRSCTALLVNVGLLVVRWVWPLGVMTVTKKSVNLLTTIPSEKNKIINIFNLRKGLNEAYACFRMSFQRVFFFLRFQLKIVS